MSKRDGEIKNQQWMGIKKLLDDASDSSKKGKDLRDLFQKDVPKNDKLKQLKKYHLEESDLDEIHKYLENIFHDSPLRFWWW